MLVRQSSGDVSLFAKILGIHNKKVSRSDLFNTKIFLLLKILFKWSYCLISPQERGGEKNGNKSTENLTLYPDLISQSKQHSEEAGQVHLSGRQLASPRVVGPVQGCGTVHNQQCVPTHKTNYNVLSVGNEYI